MESCFPLRAVRVVPSTAFLAVTIDFPASHWPLTVGQISTFSGCHSASHCLHIRRSVNNTETVTGFFVRAKATAGRVQDAANGSTCNVTGRTSCRLRHYFRLAKRKEDCYNGAVVARRHEGGRGAISNRVTQDTVSTGR